VTAVGKTYTGDRTMDGIQVSVDGRPLDPRFDLRRFSDGGFEWSYEGPEPEQLAFALLVDHLGDPARLRLHLVREIEVEQRAVGAPLAHPAVAEEVDQLPRMALAGDDQHLADPGELQEL